MTPLSRIVFGFGLVAAGLVCIDFNLRRLRGAHGL